MQCFKPSQYVTIVNHYEVSHSQQGVRITPPGVRVLLKSSKTVRVERSVDHMQAGGTGLLG